jgi:methylmalonyl-CoA/ethylmalonyl-CoA epimerase
MILHHVGFVVADIQKGMEGFCRSLNATWDQRIFEDPLQKVRVAFLMVRESDALIELVEPNGEGSPVTKFLQQGGGMHHLCYEVTDVEQSLRDFKGRAALIVRRPVPAVAFGGRRIAWLITAEKLLVELLEKGREA